MPFNFIYSPSWYKSYFHTVAVIDRGELNELVEEDEIPYIYTICFFAQYLDDFSRSYHDAFDALRSGTGDSDFS